MRRDEVKCDDDWILLMTRTGSTRRAERSTLSTPILPVWMPRSWGGCVSRVGAKTLLSFAMGRARVVGRRRRVRRDVVRCIVCGVLWCLADVVDVMMASESSDNDN